MDNNSHFLWAEIGKEAYVNVDKIATKDPKTGEIILEPAGRKFRIDAKGNIVEKTSKEDPLGIRNQEITSDMAREELRRRGALPAPEKRE